MFLHGSHDTPKTDIVLSTDCYHLQALLADSSLCCKTDKGILHFRRLPPDFVLRLLSQSLDRHFAAKDQRKAHHNIPTF